MVCGSRVVSVMKSSPCTKKVEATPTRSRVGRATATVFTRARLSHPGYAPGMPGTLRIRLDLGYDGTDFSGWAEQPGRRTVWGELVAALAVLFTAGSGRGPPVWPDGRTRACTRAVRSPIDVDGGARCDCPAWTV